MTLMKKLQAAETATRECFPWPAGTPARVQGDTESFASAFDCFGIYFDKERRGARVFTTLHTFRGKSDEEKARALEAIAASAVTSGACCNPACESRKAGEFVALSACSRCRSVYYCNASCQREDWPAHKAICKRASQGMKPEVAPRVGETTISVDDAATSFSRCATAAVVGASGPIAMLAWIWRSKAGYRGELPSTRGVVPPVVLFELADSETGVWKSPLAMRMSELVDPLCAKGTSPWLEKTSFPVFFVRLIMDETPGGIGAQVRSGERVLCIVTTPARDPRLTKWLTLVHRVPVPILERRLKAMERAEQRSEDVESMYALQLLEARSLIARPVFGEEADLLFGSCAPEDEEADRWVDRTFCNLTAAMDFDASTPLAPVHGLLVSDMEMVFKGR